jgi:predicted ATPase
MRCWLRWCASRKGNFNRQSTASLGLDWCFGKAPPHANYLFKHAMVQDAAYGTLLRERRRALHARIAETLETHFADIGESEPELLARAEESCRTT